MILTVQFPKSRMALETKQIDQIGHPLSQHIPVVLASAVRI
jgi:hypothetical protein